MKVDRQKFVAAALALSAAAGCDLSASIASRISPEKSEEGVPAAQAQGQSQDESLDRRGVDTAERGAGVARGPSPTQEGKVFASPTQEGFASPTKEAIVSPTKEGIASPTKEWGVSPTKEALPPPTKEVAAKRPAGKAATF